MNRPAHEAVKSVGRLFDAAIARERAKQDKYRRKERDND